MARRTSASIALLGLYSLNMSSMDGSAVTIKIEPEAGYTCTSFLLVLLLFSFLLFD